LEGAATVHATPTVHALQTPLPHTRFAPQLVPFTAALGAPVSTQTDVPEAQEVVPTSHGLPGGVHVRFAVHATHCPPLHTSLVPHDVPFVAEPVSLQTIWPAEQVTVPTSQGLPEGTQAAPLVQAAHVPALQ
jgi:hypothetical protein